MLMDDGLIVPGVRHFSPDMRAVLRSIYGNGLKVFGVWLRKPYHLRVKEQGFIDTRGNFLTRNQAYNRVLENCQCFKFNGVRVPDTTTDLFSEDLY